MTASGQSQAVSFHDQLAEQWEAKYARAAFMRRAELILTIPGGEPRPGEHWLDAGCGTGTLARRLARHGCRVTAVDASERMIEVAQRNSAGDGGVPTVHFVRVSDLGALPFAAGSFDGVMCSSVIEYLETPASALAEIGRVLRSGGRLIASVPNQRSWLRGLQRLAYRATKRCGLTPWPGYIGLSVNEYTPQTLTRLLTSSGLAVRAWRYYGPPRLRALSQTHCGATLLVVACTKVTA